MKEGRTFDGLNNLLSWSVISIFCAVGLAGCGDNYSWHQKLTLEVETPQGLVNGSSVVEINWSTGSDVNYLPGATNSSSSIRGEATVVEVLPGKYLFALVNDAEFLGPKVFAETKKSGAKSFGPMLQAMRKTKIVPSAHYPIMVTFTDLSDPKTVKKVDPNNLGATFGVDVSLKRLTLEVTDEDVTGGKIGSVLTWLDTIGEGGLDGSSISSIDAKNRLANILSRSNFRTGS